MLAAIAAGRERPEAGRALTPVAVLPLAEAAAALVAAHDQARNGLDPASVTEIAGRIVTLDELRSAAPTSGAGQAHGRR